MQSRRTAGAANLGSQEELSTLVTAQGEIRRENKSHRHDLRRQILLQEALYGHVRVAPGPLEDLPEAADAYSRPQCKLIRFNLPLCAGICILAPTQL